MDTLYNLRIFSQNLIIIHSQPMEGCSVWSIRGIWGQFSVQRGRRWIRWGRRWTWRSSSNSM